MSIVYVISVCWSRGPFESNITGFQSDNPKKDIKRFVKDQDYGEDLERDTDGNYWLSLDETTIHFIIQSQPVKLSPYIKNNVSIN